MFAAAQTPDSATPVARMEMQATPSTPSSAGQPAMPQASSVKTYGEAVAGATFRDSGDRVRVEMQSHVRPFPWDRNG